jgi:hypothetical protein
MGIPNKQIGWGTKENLLWQIAKQLEKLTYQIYNTGGGGGSVTSVGLTSSTPSITITGSPVTGSGNLNFEIGTASSLAPGLLSSADWTTFNSKQGAITLTTSGTSGAATLIGNILNIPQYSGGGGGNTIYTGDGTLAGNRQVTLGGNRLDVIGSLSTTTFASNGNIGIGTNSPAVYPNYTTLEINNPVAGGLIALSGGGSLRAQMYVDGNGLNIRSVGNQLLQLGANSIGALYIYPLTQNVSINTSVDAGYKLNVNGSVFFGSGSDYNFFSSSNREISTSGQSAFFRFINATTTPGTTTSIGIDTDNLLFQFDNVVISRFYKNGDILFPDLAGTGTRMVVADSTGILSTQAIPGGGGNTIYTGDGSLTANRTLTYNGYSLTFSGSGSSIFTSSVGYYSARFGSQFFGDQWLFLGNDNNCPALQGNNAAFNSPQPIALNANGGNVGVGILTPEERLHVVGNTIIKYAAFSGAKLIMNNTSTGAKSYSIYSGGSSNLIGAGAFAIADETAGVNRLVISTAGNILIGTTTDAGYKLAVNGTARVLTSPNTSSFTVSVGSSSSDIVLGGHGVSSDFSQLKIGNDLIFSRNGGGTATIQSNLPLAFISDTNTFVGAGNVPCTWLMVGNFSLGTPKFGISNSADSDLLFGNAEATYTYKQNTLARNVLWYQSDTSTSPTKVASALMSLESTTRGFLLPRMTTTQRDAITSPATGLSIYNTTTNSVEFYNGSVWTTETLNANRQTASYTLVIADAGKLVETNVASANNLTVPANSSVPFGIGTQILLAQYGAGQTTVVADTGVTIRSSGGKLKLSAQYSGATLVKIGTNEWYLFGDITI